MVVIYDAKIDKSWSSSIKMNNRWLGPYVIRKVETNGAYRLSELDGTPLFGTVAGDRVKKFFTRDSSEDDAALSSSSIDLAMDDEDLSDSSVDDDADLPPIGSFDEQDFRVQPPDDNLHWKKTAEPWLSVSQETHVEAANFTLPHSLKLAGSS